MASPGERAMFGVGGPAVGGPAGRPGVTGVPVSPDMKSLDRRKFPRAWAILSDNNIPSPITSIENRFQTHCWDVVDHRSPMIHKIDVWFLLSIVSR